MRLYSWNVNGIRAGYRKKTLQDFIEKYDPDVLALQETKAQDDQIPSKIIKWDGYNVYHRAAVRKGYSGVLTMLKNEPISTEVGLGVAEFDTEGRTLRHEYGDFFLVNIYYPNGGRGPERVDFKLRFYDAFLDLADRLRKQTGKGIIATGDFNTAHREIDLARPKENEDNTGFLPEERAWLDKLVDSGYIDTFRLVKGDVNDRYSWWDYKTRARERNVGWRIDYFFVSEDLKDRVKDADILDDVLGSDHCPIYLEIE